MATGDVLVANKPDRYSRMHGFLTLRCQKIMVKTGRRRLWPGGSGEADSKKIPKKKKRVDILPHLELLRVSGGVLCSDSLITSTLLLQFPVNWPTCIIMIDLCHLSLCLDRESTVHFRRTPVEKPLVY